MTAKKELNKKKAVRYFSDKKKPVKKFKYYCTFCFQKDNKTGIGSIGFDFDHKLKETTELHDICKEIEEKLGYVKDSVIITFYKELN
jgi:hypothetical protein